MLPCSRMWPAVSVLVTATGLLRREGNAPLQDTIQPSGLIAMNASQVEGWNFCAKQWEECTCNGRVRWGHGDTWKVIDAPGDGSFLTVKCSIDHLKDILPGDDRKHCQCQGKVMSKNLRSPGLPASLSISEGNVQIEEKNAEWVFCSNQWQDCQCNNHVRWGKGHKWKVISPDKLGALFSVKCDVNTLGDPVPGEDGKHCQCLVSRGSLFEKQLNPMLLRQEIAEASGARMVSSCEIFEAGKGSREGQVLWEAVEPFCSQAWEDAAAADPSLHAGPRRIPLSSLQKLLQSRVDPRFVGNYDKLVGKDGWFDRAFVNYFAGAPGSKHANMTEQLIRSVHMFSAQPIVVVHLGSRTPDSWTAERFPRLLLFHAAPMGPDTHRSFNFNKLRSFLMARARTGVELDSDQFVGPGVDYMFEMTEKEITKESPLPVLPVHFYSFTEADTPQNLWWRRYCPDPPACTAHTMRWSHAHPTWTFWSLPFVGRWLRRHFRDEHLPQMVSSKAVLLADLAVAEIPEDEDLLNVGTWEEKGTKQWCKFDNDYHEFADMLSWQPENGDHTTTGDIASDPKFYPQGAAKAFFTAHNCKDPAATAKMLDEIEERWKKGLYPTSTITYKGRFFESGRALREAHPELPCIL
ncbi:unnamed protein product [Effrenium voratum]|nr:unnamed protein product [Effrenium voratum]|mmetsp:Transcript_101941/g.243026  ORF Transcript_101941/g.243026 Transcript_101941/m.243026 type:complete len:634 (+) Transcript_101941:75-1976(+)